jgi:prepilin-type N-terminal cleavage/methylation domain-containing protein
VKHNKQSSSQAGFSLVEILISITIGLIILVAIGTAYVNSNNSLRQREDQAELNDPARIVMRMLRHDLAQAGFIDIFDIDATNRTQATSLFQPGNPELTNVFVRAPAAVPVTTPLSVIFPGLTPIFGCDGDMNSNPNALATAGPPAAQACGAASATRHTLQIAYQGVPRTAGNPTNSLIALNAATGDGLDCLQQNPPAGTNLVINRFTLSPLPIAAGAASELLCGGSGNAGAQPIATGVEEFVLRYQMAAPGNAANLVAAGGGQAAYISAALVNASVQGWAGVTAVEVCMVSATPITRGPAAQGTVALQTARPTCQRAADGTFLPDIARVAGDTRLWKRYTSVVAVRNAVFATPL